MNDKIFLKNTKNIENGTGNTGGYLNQNGNGVLGQAGSMCIPSGPLLKKTERKDNFKKKEIKPVNNSLESLFAQI